ncbi:MAG: DUF1566 domain-containing protein [Gammaproteobacteria bacterium]|nr:DUF1566 domain-containing protein [Gammaproteobacteria bacterium]
MKMHHTYMVILLLWALLFGSGNVLAIGPYQTNGDGTVTDSVTSLVWQQSDDGTAKIWKDALAYCEGLGLAGNVDWRLPDIRELGSIVNDWRYEPAIDTDVFLGARSDNYWSGSSFVGDYTTTYSDHAVDSSYAWHVGFYKGGVSISTKDKTYYVRCVRAGPGPYYHFVISVAASSTGTEIFAGTQVDFSIAIELGGTPSYTFSIDFGDGTFAIAPQQNIGHVYTAPGTYTAVVTVTDAKNQTAAGSVEVTITNTPPASASTTEAEGVLVSVDLNKTVYTHNDRLLFSAVLNGRRTTVDLYAALMFPAGYFVTFAYPDTLSPPNQIIPYQTGLFLDGKYSQIVLDLVVPIGLAPSAYQACAVITAAGSDPWQSANWIHFDCKSFDLY